MNRTSISGMGQLTEEAIYLYCDKCGSFSIAKRLDFRTTTIILATVFIGYIFGKSRNNPIEGFVCFNMLLVLLLLTGVFGPPDFSQAHEHKCRKCKNRNIGLDNSLNYAEYDTSKIDVPDRLTHKHYFLD